MDIFTTHWTSLPHIGHLYHTFDLIRTILLHTRQIYYTFTLIHTILLLKSTQIHSNPLKSTQIHSNPLKPPFYYTFDLILTILLHTRQIYYTFTLIRTSLLHIYESHVHLCDFTTQNQETGAKTKSTIHGGRL